ncbi:hypothetical protein [Roseovarius phycicola]|uniref:Uncharacterized protein n=1 Tax=Roseovarius phycicola TaxID=3080976 RepID=A0ABZ2HKI8_9RHOB
MTMSDTASNTRLDEVRAMLQRARKDQLQRLLFDIRASGATPSVEETA